MEAGVRIKASYDWRPKLECPSWIAAQQKGDVVFLLSEYDCNARVWVAYTRTGPFHHNCRFVLASVDYHPYRFSAGEEMRPQTLQSADLTTPQIFTCVIPCRFCHLCSHPRETAVSCWDPWIALCSFSAWSWNRTTSPEIHSLVHKPVENCTV